MPEPVLEPLDGIENRDALLNPDGTEAEWPEVDAIVGNPPFLGGKESIDGPGLDRIMRWTDSCDAPSMEECSDFSDFVCYWFFRIHGNT